MIGRLSSRNLKFCISGSVSLVTLLVYLNSLQNGFVGWDDGPYITANPFIRSLNLDFFRWAFLDFYSYNWHPLTWISHALDYSVWGSDPFGHHLTGILLHATNTFVVVLLTARLLEIAKKNSPENGRAAFLNERSILLAGAVTGLLFGLHPLHVESVAWAAERKDLLCALFFLLAILSYLRYANGSENAASAKRLVPRYFDRWYLLALGCFLLALLSKPMAVSLPFVLLIIDWHPLGRIQSPATFRTVVVEKLPFAFFSLLSSIVTVLAQRSGHAILEEIPLSTRALVAARSLIGYLWNMAWPLDLLPFYPYPRDASASSLKYLAAVALVLGITASCVVVANRRKMWLSAWGYYLGTLVPVVGIIQVGGQSMADRYTYLPSLGPFLILGIVVAWGFSKIDTIAKGSRIPRIAATVVILLLFASMSAFTVRQIGIWKSGIDLWTHVIEKEPDSVLFAYYSRAHALSKAGRYREAIEDYSKVIALNYKEFSPTYIDRGLTYMKVGQVGLALSDFRKACALGDDFGCKAAQGIERMLPR
jgi:tetratricopeptide (TPR) repeat protein